MFPRCSYEFQEEEEKETRETKEPKETKETKEEDKKAVVVTKKETVRMSYSLLATLLVLLRVLFCLKVVLVFYSREIVMSAWQLMFVNGFNVWLIIARNYWRCTSPF